MKVEGTSCLPVLRPGKRYWATGLLPPHVGDFVAFYLPSNTTRIFVKRIKSIRGDVYEVEGINALSTPSEDIGPVPKSMILGKILLWG